MRPKWPVVLGIAVMVAVAAIVLPKIPHRAERVTQPGPTCVATTLAAMSTQEKAGQLLMIGVSVDAPSGVRDTVSRYKVGGIFLHGRSTRTASRLGADITSLKKLVSPPPLISLDQEGGEVQTLKGPDFPPLPTAQKLGSLTPAQITSATQDSAQRLAAIGVTLNLAPVADTVSTSLGRDNPPIGFFHREYGNDPSTVAAAVSTIVPASQQAGVLTTVKHFPGLGRVRANTDTARGAVDTDVTATDPYLQPFEAGIKAGTAAVMISSASYPRLDPDNLAVFSHPIVTDLLRTRLGFQGLIVSDDVGAAVAVSNVGLGDRAVRFVEAGGDLVLTIHASDAAAMAKALIAKASTDQAFAAQVNDAVTHVLQAKDKAGLLTC